MQHLGHAGHLRLEAPAPIAEDVLAEVALVERDDDGALVVELGEEASNPYALLVVERVVVADHGGRHGFEAEVEVLAEELTDHGMAGSGDVGWQGLVKVGDEPVHGEVVEADLLHAIAHAFEDGVLAFLALLEEAGLRDTKTKAALDTVGELVLEAVH